MERMISPFFSFPVLRLKEGVFSDGVSKRSFGCVFSRNGAKEGAHAPTYTVKKKNKKIKKL